MRRDVTDQGVLIPKVFLEGVNEVEIKRQDDVILVIPVPSEDPILQLGQDPITEDTTDPSSSHDQHIYRP
ncbi:MAG TPA: hypothetical protein VI756_22380 [Blastocatellia bacterium]